jgi:lipoprotein-anchoring transpeptidase ErfK/SrfK
MRLLTALSDFILTQEVPFAERRPLFDELKQLSINTVFDPASEVGFLTDVVGPGETYSHIARRIRQSKAIQVSTGMLQALNGVDPKRLREGKPIKFPVESPWVLVDKSDFLLYVMVAPGIATMFPIGIGRDDRTPEGEFRISGKSENPNWRDPRSGRLYRFGEPGHLIGTRWLGFADAKGPTHFGIHGTIAPDSIGKAQSDGCVRLRNEDVERLYELMPEGARVFVRP